MPLVRRGKVHATSLSVEVPACDLGILLVGTQAPVPTALPLTQAGELQKTV